MDLQTLCVYHCFLVTWCASLVTALSTVVLEVNSSTTQVSSFLYHQRKGILEGHVPDMEWVDKLVMKKVFLKVLPPFLLIPENREII